MPEKFHVNMNPLRQMMLSKLPQFLRISKECGRGRGGIVNNQIDASGRRSNDNLGSGSGQQSQYCCKREPCDGKAVPSSAIFFQRGSGHDDDRHHAE